MTVFVASYIAGCAASSMTEKTQKVAGYDRMPERIFFVANIRPQITALDPDLLAEVIRSATQACARTTMVYVPGRLVIEDPLQQQLANFAPDAIINIEMTRPDFVDGHFQSGTFVMQMNDTARRGAVWTAEIYMRANTFGGVGEMGTRAFATQIVDALKRDNLIPSTCTSLGESARS